jgi:hypothetical protein
MVLVRVRNTVTVVCETASRRTVSVVVTGPAAVEVKAFEGGILAPITDLNIGGTMVGMFVVTLVWMDSIVVVDNGTFVVKSPLPGVMAAGCARYISYSSQGNP